MHLMRATLDPHYEHFQLDGQVCVSVVSRMGARHVLLEQSNEEGTEEDHQAKKKRRRRRRKRKSMLNTKPRFNAHSSRRPAPSSSSTSIISQ